MPKRQNRHTDNELIDSLTEYPTPSQQGRSGGTVAKEVGTRAELASAIDPDHHESVVGSDDPKHDAAKGKKTRARIERDNSPS